MGVCTLPQIPYFYVVKFPQKTKLPNLSRNYRRGEDGERAIAKGEEGGDKVDMKSSDNRLVFGVSLDNGESEGMEVCGRALLRCFFNKEAVSEGVRERGAFSELSCSLEDITGEGEGEGDAEVVRGSVANKDGGHDDFKVEEDLEEEEEEEEEEDGKRDGVERGRGTLFSAFLFFSLFPPLSPLLFLFDPALLLDEEGRGEEEWERGLEKRERHDGAEWELGNVAGDTERGGGLTAGWEVLSTNLMSKV